MTTEIRLAVENAVAVSEARFSAIDRLIDRGYSREAAEEYCAEHPPPEDGDIEDWIAKAADDTQGTRRAILDEHHEKGIPPFEPPALRATNER